jgi:dipeptide/tripeptide permease
MVRTRHREPDELGKMIIGSLFTIAGGLCLYIAALTQGGGKISLFWPLMFHLVNSIGFAHILPVALALFSKIAPPQLNATVIGLHYLAFFAANKIVGEVGKLYSTLDTPTFWLIHVASRSRPTHARTVQGAGQRPNGGKPRGSGERITPDPVEANCGASRFTRNERDC